jgi:drug/metabolite transporter (DMT)-like permease
MKTKDILALLLLAAIWGNSYLFLRIVTPVVGIFLTMGFRIIIAAAVMIILFALLKKLPDYKQYWKQFVILGILNLVLPFTLITYAVANLNASLTRCDPQCHNAFIYHGGISGLVKRKADTQKTHRPHNLFGRSDRSSRMDSICINSESCGLNIFLTIGCTLLWNWRRLYLALFTPYRTLKNCYRPDYAGAVLAMPLIGFSSTNALIDIDISIAIIVLAILCTAYGYTLYFKLITNVGSTNTSLVTLLVPVFSLLWGILFLNEPLTPALLIALVMIWVALSWHWLLLDRLKYKLINNLKNT